MIPRRKVVTYRGMLKDIAMSLLKGKFIKGAEIGEFEKKFARYMGIKHAIAVSSGRFGMELLLKSLNLTAGDEVIIPAYTFYALPQIIIDLGLKPVFVDIKRATFGLDVELIEKKISRRTKVIITTHLFGLSCDILGIKKIADKCDIEVIEDCAHSLGAEYALGKKVGSCGIGGFFSLDTHKPINTLGGGIIVTNEDRIARSIRNVLSQLKYSQRKICSKIFFNYLESFALSKAFNFITMKILHDEKLFEPIKTIYRKIHRSSGDPRFLFSNIQAILGIKQLKNLDEANAIRISIGRNYLKEIVKVKGPFLFRDNLDFLLQSENSPNSFNYHIFLCFIILVEDAKKISKQLANRGIDTASQENVVENCGHLYDPQQSYPVTELVTQQALELPVFLGLKKAEVEFIIERLKIALS